MLRDDDLLATHNMSELTASCTRCGFSYAVIIADRIPCGKPPKRKPRRIQSKSGYESRVKPNKDQRYGWIRAVVEPETREGLVAESLRQEMTLSEIVRQACRAYLSGDQERGWTADDLRAAITRVSQQWTQKPLELEGWMLIFGMTPSMVEDIIAELKRPTLGKEE